MSAAAPRWWEGRVAPPRIIVFATLYLLRRWKNGQLHDAYQGGRQLSLKDDPAALLG